jgi:hypothetical protein
MTTEVTRRIAIQGLSWTSASHLLTASSWATAAPVSLVADYTGVVDMPGGRIALSSDGSHALVYLCNGTPTDPPSLAQWIQGEITPGGAIHAVAKGVTLDAQLQGDKATGTVTLPDGGSHRFFAGSFTYGNRAAGLYRAEAHFGGVGYVGGWVVNPPRHKTASDEQPSFHPVAWPAPLSTDLGRHQPLVTRGYEEGGFLEDYPRTGGAIFNQQTGAVLPYVEPNFAKLTAEVPGLGVLHLHRCLKTKCG